MSFFRHWEIYRSDVRPCCRERRDRRPRPHRLDESPVSYSLARLLSSRACLRFANRDHSATKAAYRTMSFQRTVSIGLTGCLSLGVHSTLR
jgi:hypothetical protein